MVRAMRRIVEQHNVVVDLRLSQHTYDRFDWWAATATRASVEVAAATGPTARRALRGLAARLGGGS